MIYRISLILEAWLIIKCIYDLYGEKLRLRTELIVFMAGDLILMECVHQGCIPNWCSSLIYVMFIVYCVVVFKARLKQLVVNLVLAIVIQSVLQILCFCALYITVWNYLPENISVLTLYIMMAVVYMVIIRFIKIERISKYFQQTYVIVRMGLIIVCCGIVICTFVTRVYWEVFGIVYLLVVIPMIFVCVVVIGWVRNKEKTIEAEAQLQAYMLYGKSYENLVQEMRRKQHEFDNHINALYGQHLLYKDYESLVKHQKEYCQELKEDQKYAHLLKVGNTTLAGFLYGKFVEAEKCGIAVTYDIKTTDIMEEIPEYKITELIGNLVNNAIDALESYEDKRMNVKIYKIGNEDIIVVENTGDFIEPMEVNRLFQKGYSNKGVNRGLGLYSIKKMSEEYDFKILCSNNEYDRVNWISFTVEKKCKEVPLE